MEGGDQSGRREHRSGRARAHGRRSAAPRLVAPHGPEHRGPPSHGDRPQRQDRGDQPDPERVDGLHERGGGGRPGRPARLLGRLPDHRLERSAARDEHGSLTGRWRELGASARPGGPGRRAVVREQHGGDRARRRDDAAGLRRHARHVGPRRPLAGDAEPRLPGADRPVRLRPEPRHGRGEPDRDGVVLERERPPRRARAGRWGGWQPRGQRADDAEHERHADRHARPDAARGARTAAASTSPIRPATPRRRGSACGGSAHPTRR